MSTCGVSYYTLLIEDGHIETLAINYCIESIIDTRQVTRATHTRNRVCLRVEFILKIIIILLIIFLGFIKSKPC